MLTLLAFLLAGCADGDKPNVDDTGTGDTSESDCNPDTVEICDGVDNDCDGEVDEDPSDPGTWYADADHDGFGDPGTPYVACTKPAGSVADDTDCDDADGTLSPGAAELCDDVDNDCDGLVDDDDDDRRDAGTWYPDADFDGFGDPAGGVTACDAPEAFIADATDCDDAVFAVNPAAAEVCDGIDNDCDTQIDDADASLVDAPVWYADADRDLHGNAEAPLAACVQPEGHVAGSADCNDENDAISPSAREVCDDGVDNNCDSVEDEGCGGGEDTGSEDTDISDTDSGDTDSGGGTDSGDTGTSDSGDTGTSDSGDTGTGDTASELAFCDGMNTGDTFLDGSSMGGPGLLLGIAYTPTEDMDVGRIDMFTGESVGTNTVALWSDDGGAPGVELASGSWSMDRANGWQGADLDACIPVTAGTTYWVVWAPINGSQSTWDESGTTSSYRGSFDGGDKWNGPYSGFLKYRLSCCE